jgi:hypothetical protein
MKFIATFNNISVISWRSVLLLEESGVPEKTTNLPQVTVCPIFNRKQSVQKGPTEDVLDSILTSF